MAHPLGDDFGEIDIKANLFTVIVLKLPRHVADDSSSCQCFGIDHSTETQRSTDGDRQCDPTSNHDFGPSC